MKNDIIQPWQNSRGFLLAKIMLPEKENSMGNAISKLTIKGYKSIRELKDFELRNINILIGPNGSGKSNFLSFFRLLGEISKGEDYLQQYVKYVGGADKLLYMGTKVTSAATVSYEVSDVIENFILKATSDNKLEYPNLSLVDSDTTDNEVFKRKFDFSKQLRKGYRVYHFHDTSDFAGVKRPCTKRDYEYLRPDGSNLAAFLLFLKQKHEKVYRFIREVIQLVAPFFGDFLLRDFQSGLDVDTLLEWKQKGSDYPFHPSQLSDGTLRFICLATALLQPEPPSTILLDEPELGLHPMALSVLAGLIQKASYKSQIIVSTQSASLIDHFAPEDIILVERNNDESIFIRPDTEKLKIWLEDYSLGDLWSRNIINGVSGQ